MYNNMYRLRSRKKYVAMDYLLPFLLILAVFIVLVLLFNLAKSLLGSDTKQSAYMHIVEGDVQMRTWGTEDFLTLSSDALIMEGDEIVTSSGTKVIVEFFDGTILRASAGADLAFEKISGDGEDASIEVVLLSGDLWINKAYESDAVSQVSVKAGSAVVKAGKNTVFAVSKGQDLAVRGIQGENISVDILGKAEEKVVETEQLGIGQEIVLTKKALDKYWLYQSPSVVAAISDEFKKGEWCLWNGEEDKKPTQFEKAAGLVKVPPQQVGLEETTDENAVATNEVTPDVEGGEATEGETIDTAEFSEPADTNTPVLVSVAGQPKPNADGVFVVTSRVATITGTVPSTVTKVTVNDYVLQKFKVGDTTWSYFANADFGLMREGENTFNVYAYDADGVKSGELVVKILYQPKVVAPAEETTPLPAQ